MKTISDLMESNRKDLLNRKEMLRIILLDDKINFEEENPSPAQQQDFLLRLAEMDNKELCKCTIDALIRNNN